MKKKREDQNHTLPVLTVDLLQDEKKMFYARLSEAGANGQWGIFSMKIPGRVGYQVTLTSSLPPMHNEKAIR